MVDPARLAHRARRPRGPRLHRRADRRRRRRRAPRRGDVRPAPGAALATAQRAEPHLLLGEAVATAGLVLVVQGLRRIGRPSLAPVAVAGYIGAAIWFTSSGSFANPAATVGRAFSDSFTGIAPGSVPAFAAAQLLGMLLGMGLAGVLYGTERAAAEPEAADSRRTV
ncbi:hypothetical protein AB6O49_10335 [Streptomyces sp. SBR177]